MPTSSSCFLLPSPSQLGLTGSMLLMGEGQDCEMLPMVGNTNPDASAGDATVGVKGTPDQVGDQTAAAAAAATGMLHSASGRELAGMLGESGGGDGGSVMGMEQGSGLSSTSIMTEMLMSSLAQHSLQQQLEQQHTPQQPRRQQRRQRRQQGQQHQQRNGGEFCGNGDATGYDGVGVQHHNSPSSGLDTSANTGNGHNSWSTVSAFSTPLQQQGCTTPHSNYSQHHHNNRDHIYNQQHQDQLQLQSQLQQQQATEQQQHNAYVQNQFQQFPSGMQDYNGMGTDMAMATFSSVLAPGASFAAFDGSAGELPPFPRFPSERLFSECLLKSQSLLQDPCGSRMPWSGLVSGHLDWPFPGAEGNLPGAEVSASAQLESQPVGQDEPSGNPDVA